MLLGSVATGARKLPELVLRTSSGDSVLGLRLDPGRDYLRRWSRVGGQVVLEQGKPGEGSSIDLGEDFLLVVRCDMDGWAVTVNTEAAYPHVPHHPRVQIGEVTELLITGDILVNYAGFIAEGELALSPLADSRHRRGPWTGHRPQRHILLS